MAEADIPPLTRMVNEPGVREWWDGYDEERMRSDTLGDPETTALAIELDGLLIGLILFVEELDPYYKSASVDVTLDASHLGKGLGTDALRVVSRYLFEQLGHHRLTIDPAHANKRAIAAYEKVGFKPIGVARSYELGPDGAWRDALLMDLLAGELT
jgi:aminoglycoside 6'-N-acetyltransferase